ncbi:hypothetical protein VTN49DRAFT_3823 [Thermomyces lanuginosus]|uniref:uncharacterized protein n=1 Tax=Thermomyces lanuginosus TaxID=5541 RepID=UPI0037421835
MTDDSFLLRYGLLIVLLSDGLIRHLVIFGSCYSRQTWLSRWGTWVLKNGLRVCCVRFSHIAIIIVSNGRGRF